MTKVYASSWIFEIFPPEQVQEGDQIVEEWITPTSAEYEDEEDNIFTVETDDKDIDYTVQEFVSRFGKWGMKTHWTADT